MLVNLHDIAKMEVAEIRAYDMREQFKRLKQGPVAEEMAGFKVKYTSANSLVPDTLTFTDNEAIPKDIESCQKWAGEELFRATKKQLGVITLQSAVATGLGINGVRYSDQIIYVKPWTIEQIKEELKLQLQLEAVIPNFAIHEHHSLLRNIEYPITKYNWHPVNGKLPVPTEPGIGNELTEEAWKRATASITIK